jgi:hypothetical protein
MIGLNTMVSLATDPNTETSTSAHYDVFLLFRPQSFWNPGTKNSHSSILRLTHNCLWTTSVKVTLRLTVGQSVSLGVEPHLRLMARYLLLFDSYSLVFVGRPLWREDGSVFCLCCWLLPALSFSGPSPLDLATIFYCLSFETSLFVASYD